MFKYLRSRYHVAVLNRATDIWRIVDFLNVMKQRGIGGLDTNLCHALGGHDKNFKRAARHGYISMDKQGIARAIDE